jgi:hypothetical protein
MAFTTKELFPILDELRVRQKITIADFCDGVMTERTYFRYRKTPEKMDYTYLQKLLAKLGISFPEFFAYAYYWSKPSVPPYLRFLVRVLNNQYFDIAPIYEEVKNLDWSSPEDTLILENYRARYRMDVGLDTPENYQATLEKSHALLSEGKHDARYWLSLALLAENNPSLFEQYPDFVSRLIELDFRLQSLFVLAAINTTLQVLMALSKNNTKDFETLLKRYQEIYPNFGFKDSRMDDHLFQAYLFHQQNRNEECEIHLVIYLLILAQFRYGKDRKKRIEEIQTSFGFEPRSLLKKHLSC